MKTVDYKSQSWIDLRDELKDKEVRSFSLGYDGKLYVLATYKVDDIQWHTDSGQSSRQHLDRPHNFTVFVATPQTIETYIIPEQTWNYHFVQPLLNDELILVCASASDRNASVFSNSGDFKRSFSLGYAIDDIQTTTIGEIWTSYSEDGLGSLNNNTICGLHKWDSSGNELYHYEPTIGELGSIFDSYALNVDSNDSVWNYYYHEFPLVKIKDNKIIDYWRTPIKRSRHFLIWNNHILFSGGYEDKHFHLCELRNNHSMNHVRKIRISPNGRQVARGHSLVILKNDIFYRVGMPELFWSIE